MSLIGTMGAGISALKTFVKGLEVIGNNIANVNTTGYKGQSAKYADSFSNMLQRSAPTPPGGAGSNTPSTQVGTGVILSGITTNFSQGSLSSTGKETDLGISGSGFFRVRDVANDREYVTRSGDFRVDDQGYLVTQQGFRVQGLSDGSIAYAATDVGGVLTYTATATNASTVGDIQLTVPLAVGAGLTNSTGGAFTDAQVEAAAPTLRSFSIDQYGNAVAFMSDGTSFTKGQVLLQDFRDSSGLTKEGNNLLRIRGGGSDRWHDADGDEQRARQQRPRTHSVRHARTFERRPYGAVRGPDHDAAQLPGWLPPDHGVRHDPRGHR